MKSVSEQNKEKNLDKHSLKCALYQFDISLIDQAQVTFTGLWGGLWDHVVESFAYANAPCALQTFQLGYSGTRLVTVVTFNLTRSVFWSGNFPKSSQWKSFDAVVREEWSLMIKKSLVLLFDQGFSFCDWIKKYWTSPDLNSLYSLVYLQLKL